jgi:hypothetical protein
VIQREYARAWAALATKHFEVNGALALCNPNLPVLEVNAIHDFGASDLEPARTWLEANVGFVTVLRGDALKLVEIQPTHLEPKFAVEQVNWTQARALANVWCEPHDPSWEPFVTRALTEAMQNQAGLVAFLAFDRDTVAGMLLAFEQIVLLEAGPRPVRSDLRTALMTMLGSSIWLSSS